MVVVNLHRRSAREGMIALESVKSVLENKDYKILWDFSIQTDYVIEAWRPNLVVVDKKKRSCKIIDFAVPGDSRKMVHTQARKCFRI